MPELSHEDIKNAILHAGDNEALTPKPDTEQPMLPGIERLVPDTPYEGFVGSEPTEEERAGFRTAKEQVYARHRGRQESTTDSKYRPSRKAVVGSTVAGLLLATVGGGLALSRNNDREDPSQSNKPAEASAPAESGETTKKAAESAEPGIGVPGHELENLNVRPSAELIKLAQTPVLAKDYTPDGALNRLLQFENVYFTSALIEGDGDTETSKSKALGEKIYENIYGSREMQEANGTAPEKLTHDKVRLGAGHGFWRFYNDDGESLTGGRGPATYRVNCIETSLGMSNVDTKWYGTIQCVIESNFHDLDNRWVESDPPKEVNVWLENVDGQYFITRRFVTE